jgi:amidophosphoribosyltransferase
MIDTKRRLVVLDPKPVTAGGASAGAPSGHAPLEDDHFHDECGVFGVFDHSEAANMTYLGLHALQHRGQESAGIVTTDGEKLYAHRAMGLVQDAFTQDQLAKLPGRIAIGHVRYSTAGGSHIKNAQPIAVDYARGSLAVCHNGNLTNGEDLRAELEARGSIFQSDTDTEVFVHLVAASKEVAVEDRIADALTRVKGAYSLLFMTEEAVIAVRDPMGIRPLCLGLLSSKRDVHVIASEPCAFDLIGAEYVRDVEPGEMLVFDGAGMRSLRPMPPAPPRMCVFEYVYFGGPGRHRVCRGAQRGLRDGPHAVALRRPYVHRASAEHPPLRGALEAQPRRARAPRKASGCH